MFLRRNKALAALLLAAALLFAAALSLDGQSRRLMGWDGSIQETTFPATEVTSVTGPVEVTDPTAMPGITPTEPIAVPGSWMGLDLYRVRLIAVGCFLAALVFGGLFCWLGRQEKPLLGPDGGLAAIGLCLLLILVFRQLLLDLPWGMFGLGLVLGGTALVLLRSLVQWLARSREFAWAGCHRLGLRLSRGEAARYAEVQLGLIAGAAAVVLLCRVNALWLSAMAALAGCFPVYALIGLAKSVDSLARAADRACLGLEPEPGTGFYREQEEKLGRLQQAHAEAVQKAVTGERFKVELISNVSHDLRTPLTAILGYGELLQKEKLSEEGANQLAQLNRKAGYMKDLVDDLFELTKVSSGVSEPNLTKIDLIRLLEQTMGLLDDRLQAAGLTVKRHYDADAVELTTDGNRMHQVFVNLMENAIKYALPGSRLHLYVSGGTVRLTNVSAYEMDFSADEIVERFVRGDKSRSSQGSGIGLAIAQTYTQSVGGSFRVEIDGDQFSAIVELPL